MGLAGRNIIHNKFKRLLLKGEHKMDEKKSITIVHEKWGEVEGVEQDDNKGVWGKEGATYFYCNGWREKTKEQWEDVQEKHWYNSGTCLSYICGPNQRLRWAERYDLPENWEKEWFNDSVTLGDYVQQHKKPCLILERKVVS